MPMKRRDQVAAQRQQVEVAVGDRPMEGKLPGGGGGHYKAAEEEATNTFRERMKAIARQILKGEVSIKVDTTQIQDEIQSDRLGDWKQGAEFEALKTNIARRGQTQPIRVRPCNPEWTPKDTDPFKIDPQARFFLQSGRRRLAACVELGIPTLAVIGQKTESVFDAAEKGDHTLADLAERFAENTVRKDLRPLERYLSIGRIAQHLKAEDNKLTQTQIAETIGVGQWEVSLSLKFWKHEDEVRDIFPEGATTPILKRFAKHMGDGSDRETLKAEIMEAMGQEAVADEPVTLESSSSTTTRAKVPAARPATLTLSNGASFVAKRGKKNVSVTLKAVPVAPELQDEFEARLKELVESYRST